MSMTLADGTTVGNSIPRIEGNSIHNIAETVIGATLSLENKQRWAAYDANVSQEFFITPTRKKHLEMHLPKMATSSL